MEFSLHISSGVFLSVLRIMATDELREVRENNPDSYMQADTNKNEIKVHVSYQSAVWEHFNEFKLVTANESQVTDRDKTVCKILFQ